MAGNVLIVVRDSCSKRPYKRQIRSGLGEVFYCWSRFTLTDWNTRGSSLHHSEALILYERSTRLETNGRPQDGGAGLDTGVGSAEYPNPGTTNNKDCYNSTFSARPLRSKGTIRISRSSPGACPCVLCAYTPTGTYWVYHCVYEGAVYSCSNVLFSCTTGTIQGTVHPRCG